MIFLICPINILLKKMKIVRCLLKKPLIKSKLCDIIIVQYTSKPLFAKNAGGIYIAVS